jgi:hypothetical protein
MSRPDCCRLLRTTVEQRSTAVRERLLPTARRARRSRRARFASLASTLGGAAGPQSKWRGELDQATAVPSPSDHLDRGPTSADGRSNDMVGSKVGEPHGRRAHHGPLVGAGPTSVLSSIGQRRARDSPVSTLRN